MVDVRFWVGCVSADLYFFNWLNEKKKKKE